MNIQISDNRGIYEFETEEEAINYQREKHIMSNKKTNLIDKKILSCLHVYEYDKPIYGCTMNEFIDNILKTAKEVKLL